MRRGFWVLGLAAGVCASWGTGVGSPWEPDRVLRDWNAAEDSRDEARVSNFEDRSGAVRGRVGSLMQKFRAGGAGEAGQGWPGEQGRPDGQGGTLPPRDPAVPDVLTIDADEWEVVGDTFWAEGNVKVTYKGYTMTGQRIEGDRKADIFFLKGGGTLTGENQGEVVTGDEVEVNFGQETYRILSGTAVVVPARTMGQTTGPLYIKGGEGSFSGGHYHIVNGELTPCDLEHPHFTFTLRDGDLVPGKRILLRDVGLKILGKEVLRLPHLYIPLIDDRPRYLPEFGQTPDEGYYAKIRYITPLQGEDTFETRLDLMTKLGIGLGGDWKYLNETMEGGLGVYGLTGSRRTLVANWLHRQFFGRSELNVDTQFNRANYLTAPESTLLNSRARFSIPSGGGSTELGFVRTSSDVGVFRSLNQSYSVQDVRRYGQGSRTSLNLTWNDSESTSGGTSLSSSERVDVRFQGTQELRSLTADLLYQRAVPVGSESNFTGSSDRTPLLTLSSDGRRMFGPTVGARWPLRISGSVGELQDFGSQGPITRMTLATDVRRTEPLGTNTTLAWNAGYDQGLYSDDTAQYSLDYGGTLTQRFGLRSSMTMSYRNQRQFGFTPLAIDRRGRSDVFNYALNWDFGAGWGLTAQTGYDVLSNLRGQSPWQLVTFGSTYNGASSRFRFTGAYDTFNQSWGTFRADGEWEMFGARFAGAVRYDGLRSTWAGATLQFEALKLGRVTLDTLLSYNGYSKMFDAQQYRIAYDMHCTEAVLELTDFNAGFRSGRQLAFFIRIKALPFGSDFGIGRRGERIGGAGGFGG